MGGKHMEARRDAALGGRSKAATIKPSRQVRTRSDLITCFPVGHNIDRHSTARPALQDPQQQHLSQAMVVSGTRHAGMRTVQQPG